MSEQPGPQPPGARSIAENAPAPAPSIALHIEELTLHGFPAGAARYDIGAAIERELARLLAEHGLPGDMGQDLATVGINVGSFEIAPGSRPETIGRQIAEAVYRGLRR